MAQNKIEEKRAMRRYLVEIDVEWEGAVGRQKGMISDISSLGCFVMCSGEVNNGESINIFVPLGDGMKVQFRSTVVNHVLEIGFGVKFEKLNKSQQQVLEAIMEPLFD